MSKFSVAAVGVVKNKDRVLLVKESKVDGEWALPGGGLEKDETLEECVRREIKEETGLRTEVEERINTYIMTGDSGKRMFVYAFVCQSNDQRPDPENNDSVEEAKFFKDEELENLELRFEQLKQIINDSEDSEIPQIKYVSPDT